MQKCPLWAFLIQYIGLKHVSLIIQILFIYGDSVFVRISKLLGLISFISLFLLFMVNALMEFNLIGETASDEAKRQIEIREGLRDRRVAAIRKRGYDYDPRDEMTYIHEAKKTDETLIKSQCAGDYKDYFRERGYLPLGGLSRATTIAGKENGQFLTYISDRYGFRNPDREWTDAHSGRTVDIVLIGSSYAQGLVVSAEKTIAGRLRSKGYSVLNLACNSNGPLKALASLREYGKNLKAKHVIYIIAGSSAFEYLLEEMEHPVLINYLTDDDYTQNLTLMQDLIDKDVRNNFEQWYSTERAKALKFARLEKADSTLRRLAFGRHVRRAIRDWWQLRVKSMNKKSIDLDKDLDIFFTVLGKMKTFSRSIEADFRAVYLPDITELYSNSSTSNGQLDPLKYGQKDLALLSANEEGLKVLNLDRKLSSVHPVDQLFELGGYAELGAYPAHFGSGAYEIIADEIDDELNKKNNN